MAELTWRKSSRSGSATKCVEVAQTVNAVAVRDSKNPHGDHLVVPAGSWSNFLGGLKAGRFDR